MFKVLQVKSKLFFEQFPFNVTIEQCWLNVPRREGGTQVLTLDFDTPD